MRPHGLLVASLLCMGLVSVPAGTARAGAAAAGEAMDNRQTPATWRFEAKDTLTAVEMNHGDTLEFRLRNGEVRALVLEATSARVLEVVFGDGPRLVEIPKPRGLRGKGAVGLVYQFSARVRVDGQPMTLRRYVGCQESFYEPYVINGMRLWFDMVLDAFRHIPMRYPETGHLRRRPRKDARFAVQDASLPICPQAMKPWYRNAANFVDIKDCYNGDDCWMGVYNGWACHGGMDVDHPRGEPLWAPIDLDDHWLFNSLAAGHNNNRWRGLRRWPNGDLWAIQTHHLITLLVPEHTPLRAGTQYATAAGVAVGAADHTHYEFKVVQRAAGRDIDFDQGKRLDTRIYEETADPEPRQPEVFHLDPWILFWQIFETARQRDGQIRAHMQPLSPTRTGRATRFSAEGSRKGRDASALRHYWDFGDGGWSDQASPTHTFARPGVYPVTLVVDDGLRRASRTQHLTVSGPPLAKPTLALTAPDEPAFRPRPVEAMDVYGWPVRAAPHTLELLARPSRPRPAPRTVALANAGGGTLPQAKARPICRESGGWLRVQHSGTGNGQRLEVSANAAALAPGRHEAVVRVDCPGATNSPQGFLVSLTVPEARPASKAVIDDRDAGFHATPYFWVGHQLRRCRRRGHRSRYLTNGGRAAAGETARFTPDLAAGKYRVEFASPTPFPEGCRFKVRVRHASGETVVPVEPAASRQIGVFEFAEGADSFVELLAEGSEGLVIADAVAFTRLGP